MVSVNILMSWYLTTILLFMLMIAIPEKFYKSYKIIEFAYIFTVLTFLLVLVIFLVGKDASFA